MERKCILCGKLCTERETISEERWKNLKAKSKEWIGLDHFGDIYNKTNWDTDRESSYLHELYLAKIGWKKDLESAMKRACKRELAAELNKISGKIMF